VLGSFSLSSEVLGLELRLESGELRFYDPATGQNSLNHEEEAAARLAEKLDKKQNRHGQKRNYDRSD